MTLALAPATLEAQGMSFRLGYGVSSVSTEMWSPIYGPSVGVELMMGNGLSVGVDYGTAGRHRGQVSGYCTLVSCVDGPFDRDVFFRSLGLDVSAPVLQSERLDLRVGARARSFTQGTHLTHVETGSEIEDGKITDAGLGVRVEGRTHTVVAGFTPMSWVSYDRVLSTPCRADLSCYGDRHHFEFGIGVLFGHFGRVGQ